MWPHLATKQPPLQRGDNKESQGLMRQITMGKPIVRLCIGTPEGLSAAPSLKPTPGMACGSHAHSPQNESRKGAVMLSTLLDIFPMGIN